MTVSEQRKMLAAWLTEWRLEKELPPSPDEDVVSTLAPSGDGRTLFDQSGSDKTIGATAVGLRPGDIVLLPPDGDTTSARPVYVVLLAAGPDNRWLCAPFSRFSTPATEGEYATDRRYDPLKVVCAWNTGRLPMAVLARGWLVERIGASDLRVISDFALGRRNELPPARRGPPVVHPIDPRRDYIEEERCLWVDFETQDAPDSAENWQVKEPTIDYAAESSPEKDDDL